MALSDVAYPPLVKNLRRRAMGRLFQVSLVGAKGTDCLRVSLGSELLLPRRQPSRLPRPLTPTTAPVMATARSAKLYWRRTQPSGLTRSLFQRVPTS